MQVVEQMVKYSEWYFEPDGSARITRIRVEGPRTIALHPGTPPSCSPNGLVKSAEASLGDPFMGVGPFLMDSKR